MKKIQLTLMLSLLALAFGSAARAQCAKVDSLYQILRFVKADTQRINTLNALAVELRDLKKEGLAAFYTKQALKMAENAKYKKGIADALTQIALLDYSDLGRIGTAIDDYQKALEIYEELGDTEKIARTLEIIGNYHFKALDEDSHRKAIDYFERMAGIYKKLDNPLKQAQALEAIGELYGRLRNDDKAFKAYEAAHVIKHTLGISTPTNERVLAKYKRLSRLEKNIQESDTFVITIVFGIAFAVMLVLVITFAVQRNRAYQLLRQYKPEALEKKLKEEPDAYQS
ncbi:MAG: hypothetical protein OHK0053_14460 [Microscillaceae bacterium]